MNKSKISMLKEDLCPGYEKEPHITNANVVPGLQRNGKLWHMDLMNSMSKHRSFLNLLFIIYFVILLLFYSNIEIHVQDVSNSSISQ